MDQELEHRRHTLAHLLAAAVLTLRPDAKRTIGPAIDDGFYFDFEFPTNAISEKDFPALEKEMRRLLPTWTSFERFELSPEQAKDEYPDNPYKHELIEEFSKDGQTLTFYRSGDYWDLCRGGHSENPAKEIASDSFKLDRIAGAYWRGDEKNAMLTRIYGLAFGTKEDLEAYETQQEEAKKRDHRKIGKELDLFTFSELVGSGLPLFTPKGTILREEIHTYSQELRIARGFKKVWIPHITKTDLYKTSGHWDKFGDELFLVKSQETSDEFVLKPMNCPHHTQIYAGQPRSYRDLPIRYLETTTVYRDEKKGELAGISRVRSITQDDSHVFCRRDQIEEEYRSIMEMVLAFYKTMGMDFRARLSFRDLKAPEKYLGEESLWKEAEEKLELIAKGGGFDYFIAEGEAAFYGPKIDFMAIDAIGREHQLATAQLDFVQPARFGLTYTAEDGSDETPVMTHLAIAGSLERFLSVYIEHTAGNFPAWLSPVQARILPVSDKHNGYAEEVEAMLKAVNVRVEVDDASESLGKKIRNAKHEKIPYLLVVGDQETSDGTVSVESRDEGKLDAMKVTAFIKRITEEVLGRK
ncbi:MAG: threonyl-tRNA synthetase [Candidatus Parcubacteria bacterium]|jgi:threonyl-tRNA synthetase|nr:threonyl-tRNA synthetase [Candidatus Parcubacteria bacterium]